MLQKLRFVNRWSDGAGRLMSEEVVSREEAPDRCNSRVGCEACAEAQGRSRASMLLTKRKILSENRH